MEHRVLVDGEEVALRLERRGETLTVWINGREVSLDGAHLTDDAAVISIGGRSERIAYAREGRALHLGLAGRTTLVSPAGDDERAETQAEGFVPEVSAPMPGKVLEVLVEAGHEIEAGTPLIVLEAMKMEQTIKSSAAARVERIEAAPGDMVGPGEVMIVLSALD